MSSWNKIDWYCADCGEYWMTTENCSPCAKLPCWCHCTCRMGCKTELKPDSKVKTDSLATPKCHECGHDLQQRSNFCHHFEPCQAI